MGLKLDHDTLRQVGEALYGPLWQAQMASEIGVSDRTVRRWMAGAFNIPDGVWTDLAKICRSRSAALAKWANRLAPL